MIFVGFTDEHELTCWKQAFIMRDFFQRFKLLRCTQSIYRQLDVSQVNQHLTLFELAAFIMTVISVSLPQSHKWAQYIKRLSKLVFAWLLFLNNGRKEMVRRNWKTLFHNHGKTGSWLPFSKISCPTIVRETHWSQFCTSFWPLKSNFRINITRQNCCIAYIWIITFAKCLVDAFVRQTKSTKYQA